MLHDTLTFDDAPPTGVELSEPRIGSTVSPGLSAYSGNMIVALLLVSALRRSCRTDSTRRNCVPLS